MLRSGLHQDNEEKQSVASKQVDFQTTREMASCQHQHLILIGHFSFELPN